MPMPPTVFNFPSSTTNLPGPTCSQPFVSLPLNNCRHPLVWARHEPEIIIPRVIRIRRRRVGFFMIKRDVSVSRDLRASYKRNIATQHEIFSPWEQRDAEEADSHPGTYPPH